VEAMISNKPPGKNSRRIGIDLLRGIAAYAVVVIHIGKNKNGWQIKR
jgi:peptidoglycan/LPS O-acetylase OafA/YrhL